jgi:hypothetical protein
MAILGGCLVDPVIQFFAEPRHARPVVASARRERIAFMTRRS